MANLTTWQATIQDDDTGAAVVSPVVTVRLGGPSGDLADLFDINGDPIANPVSGGTDGFVQFQFRPSRYWIQAADGGTFSSAWYVDADGDLNWETRADLVSDIAAGMNLSNGTVVSDGSVQYVASTGATAISDMPGWLPFGELHVDHWGTNQAAIVAAVAYARSNSLSLGWLDKEYTSTASIPNLHEVRHTGRGRVVRGSNTWQITPQGNERNIMYVAPNGIASNDGLTASEPVNIATAVSYMSGLDGRSLDGIWRIQMAAGTFTEEGVVLSSLPRFKRFLEIYGAPASGGVPTTIWDGSSASAFAAFRGGLTSSETPEAFINFRDIKFTGWSANAIVYWYGGQLLNQNLHSSGIPRPFDFRGIRLDQTGGTIDGHVFGIRAYYQCNSNIGGLNTGETVTFGAGASGGAETVHVAVGRDGIAYIEGCNFTGACRYNISLAQGYPRLRTQNNTFGGFSGEAVFIESGEWDLPKSPSEADTYPTLTEAASAYRVEGPGKVQGIVEGPARYMHVRSGRGSGTNLFSVSGTTTDQLLSSGTLGGADWVPFRIPSFYLYSPTFVLDVEIELALAAGHGGGTLRLTGGGGSTLTLASIDLDPVSSFTRGTLKFRVINDPGVSTGSYDAQWLPTGEYANGTTVSLDNTNIRSNNETELLFRLYWEPNSTHTATFSNLITWVTQ